MKSIKPRERVKEKDKFKLAELNDFVRCNKKGVYYIEDNLLNNKFSRYFMFLRKKNVDINKLLDELLLIDKQKNE